MADTELLRVTIDKGVYDRLTKLAAKERRKESNMVEVLLDEAMKARKA